MRHTCLLLAITAILSGCGTSSSSEQAARDAGLLPADVDDVLAAPAAEPITNPYLRATRDALSTVSDRSFPAPPDKPDYAALFAVPSQSGYAGWDRDRIDASSYDALTNSLNAILQRMAPSEAQAFDRVVKYVLMNVTKDPMIAKKAVGGGQVSDQEILQVMQSYVDQRTPRQVTELAARIYQMQQRQAPGGGNAPAAPALPDFAGGAR